MSTTVLVDARYFGQILRHARKRNNISQTEAAQLLRITRHQLRQFESGQAPITEPVLTRIMLYGLILIKARNFSYWPKKSLFTAP